MPVIIIFPKQNYVFETQALADSMSEALGLKCFPYKNGGPQEVIDAPVDGAQSGDIYVELEELLPEEGSPIVHFDKNARLDREDDLQAMIEEIVAQDDSLDAEINKNACDIVLTFDNTPAAIEAGTALAYILAGETDSGVLIPAFTEEEETVWFPDADDFGDAMFGDEDGEEDEEELYEVDGEEDEDDEEK